MGIIEQIKIDIQRMLILSEQKGNLDARIVEQCKVENKDNDTIWNLKAKQRECLSELEMLKEKYL